MINKNYIRKIVDYCNENPMFRAGVFVKSRRSIFMICDLINTENDVGNHEVRLNVPSGRGVVKFKNGSTLLISIANKYNMAGQRFHVALVDNEVRKDIVYDYLVPCMCLNNPDVQLNGIIFA